MLVDAGREQGCEFIRIRLVNVCVTVQQSPRDFLITEVAGMHQRRVAVVVALVDELGAVGKQELAKKRSVAQHGSMQTD
jgi:hypothetical protein